MMLLILRILYKVELQVCRLYIICKLYCMEIFHMRRSMYNRGSLFTPCAFRDHSAEQSISAGQAAQAFTVTCLTTDSIFHVVHGTS